MAKYPTTPMCSGEILERFEPTARDTDVFVATAAKSGQTWLLALLHHLRTQGEDPHFGGRGLMTVAPWLEIPYDLESKKPHDVRARLATIEALPEPRVFKMHVIWEEIPRPSTCAAKVMTVTRDPRDLPYSMFCHLHSLKRDFVTNPPPDDFDEYFERWMELGYYFKFIRSFWPHFSDPDVLWLRYEDMKAEIERETKRILEFLGWEIGEDALDRVLSLVDFNYMKQSEKTRVMPDTTVWQKDKNFFREGAVGKNRERLSQEQEARILDRARQEFEPACFDFVISQGV